MSNFSFEKILKVTETISEFIILNIMWFVFTALGLIIFGIGPSTVAVLSILRDKIMKKDHGCYGLVKDFWKIYKREFKKSNIISIIILILLMVVHVNKMNFEIQPEFIFRILTIISIISKFIILGAGLYSFCLYVHYDMKTKEYVIKGITLFFARPLVTTFMILWTFLCYKIILIIPGLIAILGVSIYFYGIMAINYQFFMRNEERLKKYTNN